MAWYNVPLCCIIMMTWYNVSLCCIIMMAWYNVSLCCIIMMTWYNVSWLCIMVVWYNVEGTWAPSHLVMNTLSSDTQHQTLVTVVTLASFYTQMVIWSCSTDPHIRQYRTWYTAHCAQCRRETNKRMPPHNGMVIICYVTLTVVTRPPCAGPGIPGVT